MTSKAAAVPLLHSRTATVTGEEPKKPGCASLSATVKLLPPGPLPAAAVAVPLEKVRLVLSSFIFSTTCDFVVPRTTEAKPSAQTVGTSRVAPPSSSRLGAGLAAEVGAEVGSAVARGELEPESKVMTDVVEPLKTTT